MALIARAVHDLSVPISRFTPFATELFESFDPLGSAESGILCITPNEMVITDIANMPDCTSIAIVRIAPVITELRAALAMDSGLDQLQLPLGAHVVPFSR